MGTFLHPSLSDLHDPYLLPDVRKGARLLAEKIAGGAGIRIIGDYDADGVCSTYILYKGLQALHADVDYRIPERKRHGYGLHRELIDLALRDGRQVILTCDNGISEVSSITYAKDAGLSVIVTDHHNVPVQMPPADALIDPKITSPEGTLSYPFPEICGAVVAMKFLQVLYREMGRSSSEPLKYLEFAALATVCDVMPLRDENRAIVKFGTEQMNDTQVPGLRALIQEYEIEKLKAWHFGFLIGPCINAAGRLETAQEAMKLFLSSAENAAEQAGYLKTLNESRKAITESGVRDAVNRIDESDLSEDRVLVLHLPDCPDSVAGIVAGRIREVYYRPVLIAAGKDQILKGSARSIPGYSLFDEMEKASHLFEKFGGHPLAAGFSIRAENLSALRELLNANCTLTDADLTEKKYIDVDLPMSYVTLALLQELESLEPFGTGNPAPVFAESKPVLLEARRIGKEKNYLRFRIRTKKGFTAQAVFFGDADAFLHQYRDTFGEHEEEQLLRGHGTGQISLIYRPEIDHFRGESRISFKITDFIFPQNHTR